MTCCGHLGFPSVQDQQILQQREFLFAAPHCWPYALCRDKLQEQFVDLQALVDFVEVNRTGFRKALKKHDKVLGPLGHPKLLATYFPKVEASFPEKHRLRVQVRFRHRLSCCCPNSPTSTPYSF